MSKNMPTWVFEAGTYRSASTMHYQMTEAIVEVTRHGKGIGYHTEDKLVEFDVEGNKPYVVCKVFQFLPHGFKRSFDEKKGPSYGRKIYEDGRMMSIVPVRDPRDIIVSMRKRGDGRGGGFDFERVATASLPEWLGDVVKWIDFDPARSYWSKFEEFTTHLLREVRAVASYLQIDLTNSVIDLDAAERLEIDKIGECDLVELRDKIGNGIIDASEAIDLGIEIDKDIARFLSVSEQRKRQEKRKSAKPDEREHPWLPSIPGVVFGSSGHWRTWLAASEARMVEDANRAFMERFGYL